ncbi:ABC-2 type transport system permease protein [Thermocatellispora tengchongensis]|uniref:ABC-2 type transport system permease protein n=1 Tax=Thermocatellispora tengchongensis TaxID=1073253 RepID=A0A840NZA2_9ACTN|nr:ABC transporter permease subunit [Thermocatellispora tengchongensis]MBB5132089.1 ABC-2 type transport system permease protein [Thermocatellispora tengchongensis]
MANGAPERAAPARRGTAGGTLRLLGSELGLTFRRPRNIAMLAVLAAVPVIIGVVLRVVSDDGAEGGAGSIITAVAGNGMMLTFAALFVLVPLLLPVAVAVVAGDSVAGEAGMGTLRYLLAAPAGRTRLLAVKYANAVVFGLAATALVAASALITGFLLFPVGPITLLSGSTIPLAEGLVRVLVAVGYVAAGMAALAALALLLSTLTEISIGAIAATLVLVVVTQVLGAIPQLAPVEPYLLPSWWLGFDGALRAPMALDDMGQGLLVFAAYAVVCGSAAWARFTTKDITA